MDLSKLRDDARMACAIWDFNQPAMVEMDMLIKLYEQQFNLMKNNKVAKHAAVALEAWLISTESGLNSGYIWTAACPIATSLIVNRLRSEATNMMKKQANIRAALVGLSYESIRSIIEEGNHSKAGSIPKHGSLITAAQKERENKEKQLRNELRAQTERAANAERKRMDAEKELREIKRVQASRPTPSYAPSYTPPSRPVDPCFSGGGRSGLNSRC